MVTITAGYGDRYNAYGRRMVKFCRLYLLVGIVTINYNGQYLLFNVSDDYRFLLLFLCVDCCEVIHYVSMANITKAFEYALTEECSSRLK